MGDGLRIVVAQVPVGLHAARAGVDGEEVVLVDGEVVLVIVLVLTERRAGGEGAVGGVGFPARTHDELPEPLEVARVERQVLEFGVRIRFHAVVPSAEEEGIHGPGIQDVLRRRAIAQRGGEAGGGGVRFAEEVDVLRRMFVETSHAQGVLRMRIVAESAIERHRRIGHVWNPRPVDPVGEEREAGILGREVLARGGEPRVEEVEVRPGVGPHGVSGHGGGERAVVAHPVVTELQQLQTEVVSASQMRRGEIVAESVAERRKAGIPEKTRHAVESARDAAQVAADDRGLALPRSSGVSPSHIQS